MRFFSPSALFLMSLIPLVILFYLLKQKHKDYSISSILLWEEVIKDLEAVAPWQKLRKNILMLLQIAAIFLLVAALAKPFLINASGQYNNVIILIDRSFSMQAKDVKPSRFEMAKREAANFVENLSPETYVTVMTVDKDVIIQKNLSKDKNMIIEKINSLKVTNYTSNYVDATNMLNSMLKQHPSTSVRVFGDQMISINGADVENVNISQKGDNYANLLLSHSITDKGITLLNTIANYSEKDKVVSVSLLVNNKVFDAKDIEVKAKDITNVYWNNLPQNAQIIQSVIDEEDLLAGDNIAYDVINMSERDKVLFVSEGNVFIEKTLTLFENVESYKAEPGGLESFEGYDLYIFDGFLPNELPRDGSILIFNPSENEVFKKTDNVELPVIQESEHELMNYISDYSFSIAKADVFEVPLWAESVLECNKGTIAFAGLYNKRRISVWGFDIYNSDIALKTVFPVMMTNTIEWLIPSNIQNSGKLIPGQAIEFNLNPIAKKAVIKTPSDKLLDIAPPFPAHAFEKTEEIGAYTLIQETEEENKEYLFVVNPPVETESDLSTIATFSGEFGQDVPEEGQNKVKTDFNLQGILIFAVLILLLIEWWFYTNGALH